MIFRTVESVWAFALRLPSPRRATRTTMTCLILILRKDNTFSALFLHLPGAEIRVFGAETVVLGPPGAEMGEIGAGGGKNQAIGAGIRVFGA